MRLRLPLGCFIALLAGLACSDGSSTQNIAQSSGGSTSSGGATGMGGSNSSDGACPDLSGTWTITVHCVATLVGQQATIHQSGCSFTLDSPIATQTVSGTVSGNGTIALDVQDSSASPVQCSGNVVSNTMTLDCSIGTCNQTLTRG